MDAINVVQAYYQAFNTEDFSGMFKWLFADVIHEVNEGHPQKGKEKFQLFLQHMERCGLPEARGQTYRIRAGAFFEVQQGLIARVTTYYNLKAWIDLVK